MSMEDDMPMIVEEGVGIVRKMMMVCRSPRIDKLMISIVFRDCFVYRFRLVWN